MDSSKGTMVYKLVYDVPITLGFEQSSVSSLLLVSKLDLVFDVPRRGLTDQPKPINQEPAGPPTHRRPAPSGINMIVRRWN